MRTGGDAQRKCLEREGVEVRNGKVDWEKYGMKKETPDGNQI